MVFIDWLTVYQDFEPGSLPVLGERRITITDNATGELLTEFATHQQVEGSFSTSLTVSSDGTRLKVSGNPSRFGREDNLSGYSDVKKCIRLYNCVLDSLWLPPFTFEELSEVSSLNFSLKTRSNWQGCRISRIDLTENYQVGKQNVLPFIRSIANNTIRGQSGFTYANGLTTDWFRGSRRLYIKYYAKAQDYLKRLKNPTEYQQKLAEWMQETGIVRFEVSIKSKKLQELELDTPHWHQDTMENIMKSYQVHNDFNSSPFGDVALQIKELCPSAKDSECERAEQIVAAWMTGYDCRKLPKTTFYRYKKLIKYVGIDISTPCKKDNITTLIKTIEVQPLKLPDFYRHVA
jgi:hypothetical protein